MYALMCQCADVSRCAFYMDPAVPTPKIRDYLAKLWTKICVLLFGQPCSSVIKNRRT